jgi:hypothetical protein
MAQVFCAQNGAAQVNSVRELKGRRDYRAASAVTLEASNADEGTVMVVDAQNVAHETKSPSVSAPATRSKSSRAYKGARRSSSKATNALPDGTKVEVARMRRRRTRKRRMRNEVRTACGSGRLGFDSHCQPIAKSTARYRRRF